MENEFITVQKKQKNSRQLCDMWTLWAHLPHDTNWDFNSYINIMSFDKLEESINLVEELCNNTEILVKECMLFMMKNNIKPLWEDDENKNGGCFSYKLNVSKVTKIWKNLIYSLIGKTLSSNEDLYNNISGISISPKKNFCIIKLWMKNCNIKDSSLINVKGLNNESCIFKKHIN